MKFNRAMAVMAGSFVLMAALTANPTYAQTTAIPRNWHLLNYTQDSVYGTGVEKAYNELLKGKKSTPVLVAVIDSGIDTLHEDLKPILWVNPKEIPGNGIDDDKNGYVDDIHGWNFLGGKDGRSVREDSDEATREYYRYKSLYVNPDSALDKQSKEYRYWQKLQGKVAKPSPNESKVNYKTMLKLQESLRKCEQLLTGYLKQNDFTAAKLDSIQTADQDVMVAKKFMQRIFENTGEENLSYSELKSEFEAYLDDLKKKAEAAESEGPLDKRAEIIGDNVNDINDKYYGNNDVMGEFGFHGTHVSGIIAAVRGNGVGMDGINDNVRIMMVKAVPDGDERDKDVALAIRYAVDNGARVVNMSFGKGFSPHKDWVDDAVKYAEEKGVLLVHAAGNDGNDNDVVDNFPNPDYANGSGRANNYITVGASSNGRTGGKVASFSNYGKKNVDIFAPGVQIYSTVPGGNKYGNASGTSMAAPVVAGVAALVLAYHPELTAEQLKFILMKSASQLPDGVTEVNKPGAGDTKIPFADLSISGGLVNAYEALKLADSMDTQKGVKQKKKKKAKMEAVKKG
ncbi:S8 family serine peptidase [Chitinophaga rhizophila]|uniref:S8 family serine peptidase n=1 Tax=Chitinophaga rhizophila TaxID=2866212 RepID=A0ABS7GHB0_9BACT|nr:S8 family serine peptidase [Chitinophaga rhizophila]MBW8686701.1 S8 family serine peptidase [Chitinophaga rhizophila]